MPRKKGKKHAGKYPSKHDKSAAKAERRMSKRVDRIIGDHPRPIASAKQLKDVLKKRPPNRKR